MSPLTSNDPSNNEAALSNGGIGPNTYPSKTSSRVMLHHDDLINTVPNIDVNSPIKSILRECENLVKLSNVSLEFGRADIALQQYLQASIIAIEIIPRHKEFCHLKFDRLELYKLYNSLTEKIKSQDAKFMEAKKIIKKNNLLHGTQPNASKGESLHPYHSNNVTEVAGNGKIEDVSLQVSDVDNTGKLSKKPPAIQPKPKALYGQAIQASNSANSQHQNLDLAARFARLRSTEPKSPKQDPRIRTQPIPSAAGTTLNNKPNYTNPTLAPSSRPVGPRDMPSVPRTRPQINAVPLHVRIPDLPRAPDAIYSPARGTEITNTSNLPSSLRNNLHKSNVQQNAPPVSQVTSSVTSHSRNNSYSLVRRSSQLTDSSDDQKDKKIILPHSTYVTCEELVKLLAQGTQSLNILLVDLRSREAFDNGHIMSQSIICVEPITLRRGISGQDLADSMVIAPDFEQALFERRNEFDLLVMYDQSSTKMADNDKFIDFTSAAYEYEYEKRLKRPPLLLIAGLDGWTDLLGPNSLATSSTGSAVKSNHLEKKVARPLMRSLIHESQSSLLQRQKRHYSRPLTMEQENVWASTIKDELANTPPDHIDVDNELIYVRTMEDFIRRYPELPSIQESMISYPTSNKYQDQLVNSMPKPPARPAPAIPRKRSSGITEKGDGLPFSHSISNNDSTISETRRPVGLTGLSNPRVLCYMNTVIQGLSATPWFRELIKNYVHPADPPIPKRDGESTEPPQLMVRCLSSIFAHLWFGQYEFINPTTFQGYVNAVHNQGPGGFGGIRVQHDCNEFLAMLIDILDDELNPLRNLPGRRPIEEIEGLLEKASTILDAAAIYWADWTSNLGSPITCRMKGVTVRILKCDMCGKSRPVFDQFQQLLLAVPPDGTCTLNEILDANFGSKSELIEYQSLQCSKCCQNTSQKGRVYLVYLPDTLIISFMRMTNSLTKIKTRITVPLNVNFENNVVSNQEGSKNHDHRCNGPFIYDIYGLGLHSGNTLASGHYRMLARSLDQLAAGKPAGFWHMFDDRIVTPFNVTAVDPSEISLIFLQRQGQF
ncbi:Ubiquitin carboxyl-terminal hydrolase 4 [Erysiphe neolycopersici]|uniref:Ubiquitin carboxyl-terminal hydrolase 4 n=1 Tax=Erysiphe neolycopersici TaxID=212602 RepID=A0A420HDC6_9PEZI|nr:Ubiquitin carboxyl-terminal hydrolase 4 [Erysiphe neolycopersici]